MNIHLCDICKLKIPDHEKFVLANYRTFGVGGFSICKRCGEPVISFLKEHELIADED